MRTLPVRPAGCCPPAAIPNPRRRRGDDALLSALRALADPTRLRILRLLAEAVDPVCVCDITSAAGVGQPTVSHHLTVLRRAGLVDGARRGVWSYWSLRRGPLGRVREALAELGATPEPEGARRP
jgi:ArsR family transcriptional regulator